MSMTLNDAAQTTFHTVADLVGDVRERVGDLHLADHLPDLHIDDIRGAVQSATPRSMPSPRTMLIGGGVLGLLVLAFMRRRRRNNKQSAGRVMDREEVLDRSLAGDLVPTTLVVG